MNRGVVIGVVIVVVVIGLFLVTSVFPLTGNVVEGISSVTAAGYTCTDSDADIPGTKAYLYEKGTTISGPIGGGSQVVKVDTCYSSRKAQEYFCVQRTARINSEKITCPNSQICEDGRCIR